MVDLSTLDDVLNHETVDGKHILRNIGPLSHLLRLARSVSGSSAHGEPYIQHTSAWVHVCVWMCLFGSSEMNPQFVVTRAQVEIPTYGLQYAFWHTYILIAHTLFKRRSVIAGQTVLFSPEIRLFSTCLTWRFCL